MTPARPVPAAESSHDEKQARLVEMSEHFAPVTSSPPRRKPRIVLRMVVMLVCVFVLFFLVFGFGAFKNIMIGKFLKTLANPPQTVATTIAEETPWQPALNSVGSTVAINGANLSAEINGIVDTIDFQSGDDVKAGQLLLTLRPNNDPAVLAQLQATAELDQINYDRDLKQFRADAVAQATVDTDRATLASAQAQVQAQQATMAEKLVKAPFAGRLGIRQVDLGQYLAAGTAIVTLQQLNPLYIDFYLPQQALSQIGVGQKVAVGIDAYPGQSFAGEISAISSAVDTTTRTVQVRATLQNDALLLRPGMFGTVNVSVGTPRNLVTLPLTAIAYNSYGDTVFVVHKGKDDKGKDDLVADQVFVTLGDTRGDQVAVLSGVAAGDQVVNAGQLKLKNGSVVLVNNSIEPPNEPNPNPPNE
jgi:membrane fusion protein (multidrug efflux system)